MKQEVSGSDYEAALRQFGSEQEQRHEAVAKVEKRRKKVSKRRRVAGLAGLVAALALFAVVGIPRTFAAFESEPSFALGPVGDADAPGLEKSVQGLWEVRSELDLYRYHNKGKLPSRLAELKKAPQACPGCDKPWTYKQTGTKYRISCPSPAEHGRSSIALNDQVGPPLVQLDAGLDAAKGDLR